MPFEKGWGVETFSSALGRFYAYSIVAILLLLAVAWRARSTASLTTGAKGLAVCGICAVCVPLLDLVGLVVPMGGIAFDLAAIAARAVADVGLFLMWNAELARHKASVAWPAYAGSFAVAACAYFAVSAFGLAAVTAAVIALPIACCLLLALVRRLPGDVAVDADGANLTWHVPWRPVLLMAAFSFAYFLAAHFADDLQTGSEWGRLAVSLVVLAGVVFAFDRCDIGLLYRVCPALMVAGLLMCCFGFGLGPGFLGGLGAGAGADGADSSLCGFLVSAAYNGFTLYLYMTLNAVCFRYGAPPAWLFGITRAVCMAVCLPASTLGDWLREVGVGSAGTVDAIMGAAVVAIVLLGMVLMGERKPVETWGIKATRSQQGAPEQSVETGGYLENRVLRCALVARHFGLTHREEEVLSLLAQGRTFQQAEADLCIAHGTMRVHVQHVYAKLGVHSVEEARDVVERWRM